MEKFREDLPANTKYLAEKYDINARDILFKQPEKCRLDYKRCTEEDIRFMKEAAAKIISRKSVKASQLFGEHSIAKWKHISFGCSALDYCLNGGIITRGITEICGAAGSGKTQLLLQLSLTTQLPIELGGLGKGVAYICTDAAFPSKRLHEMSKTFTKRYPAHEINYMNNIYVQHAFDCDELNSCVEIRLRKVLESTNIGLIVIDSIAGVYRVRSDFIKRSQEMRKLANRLLYYANKYNCAVVCVNQVSGSENNETPCLGLAWAHLGRTRLKLSKLPTQIIINQNLMTVRKFEVMYSPEIPVNFAEFLVTDDGIVNVPSSRK